MLLRARRGYALIRPVRARSYGGYEEFISISPFTGSDRQILKNYMKKILMSGPGPVGDLGNLREAHRASLARVFVPKFPQLPAGRRPTIVAYAFHDGLVLTHTKSLS